MNSLERVTAAVQFEKPDRTPVIAQVFGHAATLSGVALGDYVRNGELLARCQIQALERYDYDAVFALMDVNVETEALGSILTYRNDRYPTIKTYALSGGVTLDRLEIPDPNKDGRMPELLKAAKKLRKQVGDDVLVVGCVVGPMTLVSQILGLESALFLAVDDPALFTRLLDFAADVVIRFGTAQLEVGVHLPIVFDPSSTPEVIPPQFYRELILPHIIRVFKAFKQSGSVTNWLHTAGPAVSIYPYYTQADVDIANMDFCVDPMEAMAVLPHICLDGNIKPWSFVDATPDEITAESSRLLAQFADRGDFILSSGCEIPPEAKPENIAAMVAAARYGR
jgi:uroporphyrinogen decarboxylase